MRALLLFMAGNKECLLMSRVTVNVSDMDKFIEAPKRNPRSPLNMKYVSCKLDDTNPFAGLLWQEIKKIEQQSNMTNWQRVVWEWTLLGLSTRDIADVVCVSHQNIDQHLLAAQKKAEAVGDIGIITSLVEGCGALAVHELLMENLDLVTPKHRWAAKLTRKAYEKAQAKEEARLKGELRKLKNTCRN
jgi:DNA-binding CsgD family transcriptional regulator